MACYFMFVAWRQPRPAVFLAVILWLLYAVWEFAAARGALVDGVYCHPTTMCQIGYDFFFWPILGLVSLFASYAPGQWTSTGKTLRTTCFVILGLLTATLGTIFLADWANGRLKRDSSQSDAMPKMK